VVYAGPAFLASTRFPQLWIQLWITGGFFLQTAKLSLLIPVPLT
jgi:hypothetical protein